MSQRISIDPATEGLYGAGGAVEVAGRIFVSGLSGDGDTAVAQFQGAVDQSREALTRLGSSLDDVVRSRIFYTEPSDRDSLGLAHGTAFLNIRPALSMTQVHFLPDGATSLFEIEAVQGSSSSRTTRAYDMPNAADWGYSGAVRVGDDIWVSGVTTLQASGDCLFPGDLPEQARWITGKIGAMIGSLGGRRTDIVSARHYTNVAYVGTNTVDERLGVMHPHHPTSAGITVQGVGDRRLGEMIEVEAIMGATESRRNLSSGRPYEEDHHY
ncbi:MAG: Rid family hydrolase, partial [SAR202 cluster bacterium]|nr:Rid family hydrolase [SAR202 cluster bacterium]